MTSQPPADPGQWVLLSYRMPREPSTRRISVWRKLKRLGVAQISDGLVALPADARTREHFDWIAEEIRDGGGTAAVWTASPAATSTERDLATGMATARAAEYRAILDQATIARSADPSQGATALRRLRAELRRITRRDYFPPVERDLARAAVDQLARSLDSGDDRDRAADTRLTLEEQR
ncbi:Chromate resistance protein ChrB [Pseudonocardia nigra]|uniref:Chromate resistance protein ChrB n=1 Tax=Pseudonocardia nigra TaxID=1921578 RepID=UPI001C5E7310|nr:Chromate resistance protein ChrB [Pseudonocardia nigra]